MLTHVDDPHRAVAMNTLRQSLIPVLTRSRFTVLSGVMLLAPVACGGDDTSNESGSSTSTTAGSGGTSSGSNSSTNTSSSTTTGPGGAGGAGGGPPGDAWGGEPPTLEIATCINENMVVVPNPGNEGHLAAARLTPSSYPFEVTSVQYVLVM